MNKIPSVEDKVVTEFFTKCRVHLRSNPHGRCAVEHALVQALTAERDAGAREETVKQMLVALTVQRNNEFIQYGSYNYAAPTIKDAMLALTPPTK